MITGDLKRRIKIRLKELVQDGGAPGFQLSLGLRDECLGVWSEGSVTDRTWFDLASLTKIISTVSLTMLAVQQKKIPRLSEPLQSFFPFWTSDLKSKTIGDLLNHRAGLPAIFESLEAFPTRQEKVRHFLTQVDKDYKPIEVAYSDVGFMILGILLEQVYGKRLRDLIKEILVYPHLLSYGPISTSFEWMRIFLGGHSTAKILSLEDRSIWLHGIAQDPRAEWLDGDAGHAGLFGSALGVELWAERIFKAYHGKDTLLSDQVVRNFIQFPNSTERWINGFDRPTPPSQAGALFSDTTIGHLGYTGCSFWMDIESGARVSLLSHRFSPKVDAEKLKSLRPAFHDWIWKQVFAELR